MNKRIEELKAQATTKKPAMVYNQDTEEMEHKSCYGENFYIDVLDAEYFANLIIEECITTIKTVENWNEPLQQWMQDRCVIAVENLKRGEQNGS